MIPADILRARDLALDLARRTPNVIGVAIGGKETRGRHTGQLAVQVFVDRKVAADVLAPGQRIPDRIADIATDVTLSHRPQPLCASEGQLLSHGARNEDLSMHRPLVGGIAMGPANGGQGTLGGFVLDEDGNAYALTNRHVVMDDGPLPVITCHQPAVTVRTAANSIIVSAARTRIGEVTAHSPGDAVEVPDAAVIRLAPGGRWKAAVAGIGGVAGSNSLTYEQLVQIASPDGLCVQKRGSTTALTGGRILAVGAKALPDGATVTPTSPSYLGDYVVRPEGSGDRVFSLWGDSGSLVLDEDRNVVGLLWGGPQKAGAYYNPGTETDAQLLDGTPPRYWDNWVTPIDDVLASFQNPLDPTNPALTLHVATADEADLADVAVNTVPEVSP
ncbi:MAG: trypsin-like peptidase domain-containing protein [Acidimicrobiales bacterium]